MFCRERHKSELHQYNISDIRHKLEIEAQQEEKKQTGLSAGIFILPRIKTKHDEYDKRPDYPESPAPIVQTGPEELIKMFTEGAKSADVNLEIDSNSQYHSDVWSCCLFYDFGQAHFLSVETSHCTQAYKLFITTYYIPT